MEKDKFCQNTVKKLNRKKSANRTPFRLLSFVKVYPKSEIKKYVNRTHLNDNRTPLNDNRTHLKWLELFSLSCPDKVTLYGAKTVGSSVCRFGHTYHS